MGCVVRCFLLFFTQLAYWTFYIHFQSQGQIVTRRVQLESSERATKNLPSVEASLLGIDPTGWYIRSIPQEEQSSLVPAAVGCTSVLRTGSSMMMIPWAVHRTERAAEVARISTWPLTIVESVCEEALLSSILSSRSSSKWQKREAIIEDMDGWM